MRRTIHSEAVGELFDRLGELSCGRPYSGREQSRVKVGQRVRLGSARSSAGPTGAFGGRSWFRKAALPLRKYRNLFFSRQEMRRDCRCCSQAEQNTWMPPLSSQVYRIRPGKRGFAVPLEFASVFGLCHALETRCPRPSHMSPSIVQRNFLECCNISGNTKGIL